MTRVRIFIDFWNFQAGWNARLGRGTDGRVAEQCDWMALPMVLVRETGVVLRSVGFDEACSLEETLVHASVDPANPHEEKLRGWLSNFVDRLPSFKVTIHERRARPFGVTDLLALGFEGAFDVALLVSSDADFAPAVRYLQTRGLKVINVAWSGQGHELKKACWADVDLDRFKSDLFR